MIVEYYRPQTLDEALALISRENPVTLPLGGGTVLNRPSPDPIAVVDLQSLELSGFESRGNYLDFGATITLESLLDISELPIALRKAIRHEATNNQRQVATLAGNLVACDGRSAITTAFLALDAQLHIEPGGVNNGLGDFLPMRATLLKGRLITKVSIPTSPHLAYQYVARTPADLPIVCVAVAKWESGRIRVAIGGYGDAPRLAMDGTGLEGADVAARDAYSQASDEWASADYRMHVAGVLTNRCLDDLSS
jgi:putative selenate reductase FAD-binding subunit